jgi:hypothetical protein
VNFPDNPTRDLDFVTLGTKRAETGEVTATDKAGLGIAIVVGGLAIGAGAIKAVVGRLDTRFSGFGDRVQNIVDRKHIKNFPVFTSPDVDSLILEAEAQEAGNTFHAIGERLTDTQIANIHVPGDIHKGVPPKMLTLQKDTIRNA